MSDLLFLDSAYPLGSYPSGVDGIAFYAGGDTPHVWAAAEIHACPYRFRLPIWVRSNPPGPGAAADASACLSHLASIGAPKGTLVAWDMETAADAAYISAVYTAVKNGGYKIIVYGSQSTELGNRNPDGLYWGADWTGIRRLVPPDAMTQYVNLAAYDESAATPTLPFWDTRAPAPIPAPSPPPPSPAPVPPPAPPPPPVPSPAPSGSATVSMVMPFLRQGMNDTQLPHEYVKRAQLIMSGVFGKTCTADGAFGPQTDAAVRAVQQGSGLQASGVIDPGTWRMLLAGTK